MVARAEQRVIYVIAKQDRKKGRFAFVYGLLLLYCTYNSTRENGNYLRLPEKLSTMLVEHSYKRERENITMKFSAVILLLPQIIAQSVGLPDCTCVEKFNSVEECVAAYWRKGYRYAAILIFLSVYHGIHWTLRQLKYFINHKLGLRRRGNQSSVADICRAITLELNGSGRCLGYRSMTQRLQSEHFYRILILMALIKEDVEDLKEGVIETQDPTACGTLTDMTS